MAEVSPGGGNTFVPTFSEATGLVQIEFSRNPTKYAVNTYTKLVPTEKTDGYYLSIDEEEAARIVTLADSAWGDGQDKPEGGNIDHEFTAFRTTRHTFPFKLGDKAVKNADFDVVAAHARAMASKCMRLRTYKATTAMTTTGSWPTGTTDTAANVGGGQFTGSTAAQGYIQLAFNGVVEAISNNTNEVVEPKDITAVMNDVAAHAITESPEYKAYFQGSPYAAGFVAGGRDGFDEFSLLSTFFGVGRIVVDKTTRITNRKGGTKARSKMIDDDVVFVSRVGGQMGVENVPDFSTVTIFAYEDMTVETFDDRENRRVRGSVTDDVTAVLTAPLSGYLLQDVY